MRVAFLHATVKLMHYVIYSWPSLAEHWAVTEEMNTGTRTNRKALDSIKVKTLAITESQERSR